MESAVPQSFPWYRPAQAVVIDWCYTFYDHQRRRSAADGLSPVNYEIRESMPEAAEETLHDCGGTTGTTLFSTVYAGAASGAAAGRAAQIHGHASVFEAVSATVALAVVAAIALVRVGLEDMQGGDGPIGLV